MAITLMQKLYNLALQRQHDADTARVKSLKETRRKLKPSLSVCISLRLPYEKQLEMEEPEARISIRVQPLGHAPFTLTLPPTTPLSDLRATIADRLKGGRIRLLFSGKQLTRGTLHDSGLRDGSALTVLRSAESEVALVQSLREDRLLRPFQAPTPKYVGVPRASARKPSLFGDIEVLPDFDNWRVAERMLTDLAEDPGFYGAMKRRGWTVGKLAEMYPAGRVGIDPVCVLGYNVNKGEEIRLRLRTDDLAGFRDIKKIRQVLAHELAHNVYSEHDDNFKELMLQVEREADEKDWTQSRGRVVGTGITRPGGSFPGRPRAAPDPHAASAHGSRLIREAEIRKRMAKATGADTEKEEVRKAADAGSVLPHMHSDECQTCEPTGTGAEERASPQTVEAESISANAEPIIVDDAQMTSKPADDVEQAQERKSAGVAEEQKPSVPVAVKNSAEVEALLGMGFTRGISMLALRETGNIVTEAADWIFSNMSGSEAEPNFSDEAVARIGGAMKRLETETNSSEQFRITLDTLHFYISNILRNPGNVRYREINGRNVLFRRRVAQYEAALSILTQTGFHQLEGDNYWRLGNAPDMAKLWMAKSIIQERLIKEFQK